MASHPITVSAAHVSDLGKHRKRNEDYVFSDPEANLFIVCDGVGGEKAGNLASRLAAETVATAILKVSKVKSLSFEEAKGLVYDAIQSASQVIYENAHNDPALSGMCTTFDLVWILGARAIIAHVGDGRILIARAGNVHRLTRDHTYGQEMIRAGHWTAEQAKASPFGDQLLRVVGKDPVAEPDILTLELESEDRFFLCSDGVPKEITDPELHKMLISKQPASQVVQTVLQTALGRAGRDNISAIVVDVGGKKTEDKTSSMAPGLKAEALKQIHFFRDLSYVEIAKILEISELREFPGGSVLMKEGEQASSLWVLLRGKIDVLVNGKLVASRGPGICFGESALLTGPAIRTATVQAASPVYALILKDTNFASLLERDPGLGCKVLRLVAEFLLQKLRKQTEITLALQSGQVVV